MIKNKLIKIIILFSWIFLVTFFSEIKNNKINDIKQIIFNHSNINNINKSNLNGSKFEFNKNFVKISVIIPVFNCEKTINSSILSIQQQNLSNIEIILVNDYSQDNSINILEDLKKIDNRIKLINNKQNHGTLYSRSIGALSAKGTYILSLDNDDEFFGKDSFDYIYNQAVEGNYDIVCFKRISVRNKNLIKLIQKRINFHNHKSLIIHQPELSIYPISKNGKFFENSFFIWDKCIKTDIYKQAVNLLGNDINTHQISYNEDIIIVFIIFSISKTMKIINKYAIIHYIYQTSTSRTRNQDYKIYCNIYFLDILFRFSKNTIYKNLCVDYFLRNRKFISKTISKEHNIYLVQILKNIINDTYITNKNKNILKPIIKEIELRIK